MKASKRTIISLMIAVVVVLYLVGRPEVAPSLSYNQFIGIAPGTLTDDVLRAIGAPISISVIGNVVCMIYAEQSMLGLGFEAAICCRSGQVTSVGVERHDLGLYWWREGEASPQMKDEKSLRRAFRIWSKLAP